MKAQGNPDSGKFQEYLDYAKAMFAMLEFDVRVAIVVAGRRSAAASAQEGPCGRLKEAGAKLANSATQI